MGKSYERDGLFGKYTEHFDDRGNKIGESQVVDGLTGKRFDHYDNTGSKIGESREVDGFFGSYTEHRDNYGNKAGESRDREGFFGTYTEHSDRTGNKTGESRNREGIFGDYTEHTLDSSAVAPALPMPGDREVVDSAGGYTSTRDSTQASDKDFSLFRDFGLIQWKETMQLNLIRAGFAGPVITMFMIFSGEAFSTSLVYLLFPFMYLFGLVPLALLAQFLIKMNVPFVGIFALVLSLMVAVGDPLTKILHTNRPDLVPVQEFGWFNMLSIIFVLNEE